MAAYYNEHDPFAAAWLRELVKAGLIAKGEVDERDIRDVHPDDLRGFAQAHFFAGIGGWSHALRLAGVPDDFPIWTGSCPCQPFSQAGRGDGFVDERHLWPHFYHLIGECRPDRIAGEQVASPNGLAWFDLVQADLEGAGYAVGVVDTCAAGVGAPHIRQRLYWVANAREQGGGRRGIQGPGEGDRESLGAARERPAGLRTDGRLGHAESRGCGEHGLLGEALGGGQDAGQPERPDGVRPGGMGLPDSAGPLAQREGREAVRHGSSAEPAGGAGGLANNNNTGPQGRGERRDGPEQRAARPGGLGGQGGNPTNGFWSDPDWLYCRDGKWRPTLADSFPLVDGFSDFMAGVFRAIIGDAKREVTSYAADRSISYAETLQMVWESYGSEETRSEQGFGVLGELRETDVLFDFLFRLSPAFDGTSYGSGVAEASRSQGPENALRILRESCGVSVAPRQRRPDGQQRVEPSEALRELSLVLARHAETYRKATLSTDAVVVQRSWGRTPMLRGLGNAIVPPLAAEVLRAWLGSPPKSSARGLKSRLEALGDAIDRLTAALGEP